MERSHRPPRAKRNVNNVSVQNGFSKNPQISQYKRSVKSNSCWSVKSNYSKTFAGPDKKLTVFLSIRTVRGLGEFKCVLTFNLKYIRKTLSDLPVADFSVGKFSPREKIEPKFVKKHPEIVFRWGTLKN